MPLTDTACKNARPKAKPYRKADSGGLYLEVVPSDGRYWRLKYRFLGKEKRLACGVYPETSLAEAREKRAVAKKMLADRIDPSSAKQRPPRPHAPLQRAPDAEADLGMAPPDLLENRNGPDAGRRLQDRHDLAVPYFGEGIGPPPAAGNLLLRWQARIVLDPEAARRRKARFGGSNGGVVGLSETHI
jgi:hypothetical protein